jgi:hypothetical protein
VNNTFIIANRSASCSIVRAAIEENEEVKTLQGKYFLLNAALSRSISRLIPSE